MATRSVDTTSQAYNRRLTDIQDILTFYGPILGDYLALKDPDAQQAWRQRDPILRELLDIHRKIEAREGGGFE